MKANHLPYKYETRLENIDKVLNEDNKSKINTNFPSPEELKYNSQFFIDVIILIVDIRSSTKLSKFLFNDKEYSKGNDMLVKLYKIYISEVVAVMKGCDNIFRIYIEGDGVWAAFKKENTSDTTNVFSAAAQISSLIDILNVKLIEKKYTDIKIGMGMHSGKSLYVLGGYKRTKVREDVWLGEVVNRAFKLCGIANKGKIGELVISEEAYKNLSSEKKNKFKSKLIYNYEYRSYHGKIPNEDMQDWLVKNSPTYIRCEGDYCHYQMKKKSFKKKFLFVVILGFIVYMWQQGVLYLAS